MLGILIHRGLASLVVSLIIVASAATALAGVTGPATVKTFNSANDLNLTNVVKATNFASHSVGDVTIAGVTFAATAHGETVNGVAIDGNAEVEKTNFKWKTPMTEIFGALNYGDAGTNVAIQQTDLAPGNYKVQLLLYEYAATPGRTLSVSLEGGLAASYTLPDRPTGTVWSQVVAVAADGLELTGTLNVDVTCDSTYGPVSGMLVSTTTESPGAATWAVVDDPADIDYADLVSATTFGDTQGTRRVGDVTFHGCYNNGNTTAQGVSCVSSGMLSSIHTGSVVQVPIEDLYGSSVWDQTDGTLNVSVAAAPGSYELDLLLHDNYAYEHLTSYSRNVDITVEGTAVAVDFNYFESQGNLQQGVMVTVPVTLSAGGDGMINIVIDGTPYGYTSTTNPAIAGLLLRSMDTVRIPGDATGDGKVNAADAEALAQHWGTGSGAAWADGDFNEDGAVNAADASILAANWGHGTGEAGAAAVPEPATMCMWLAALALGLAARRRRA